MIQYEDIATSVVILVLCCSSFASLWGAVKVIREIRQPAQDREERIRELERRMTGTEDAIRDVRDAVGILLTSQRYLIDHVVNGDHQEELEGVMDNINEYLLRHIGRF